MLQSFSQRVMVSEHLSPKGGGWVTISISSGESEVRKSRHDGEIAALAWFYSYANVSWICDTRVESLTWSLPDL